jgi:hypothetical protein
MPITWVRMQRLRASGIQGRNENQGRLPLPSGLSVVRDRA